MNIALYLNYGHYLNTQTALAKLKEHGIDHIVAWLGRDVESATTVSEHELYAYVRDNGLSVDAAILPNDQLPYLSNTRYGRKDAIKTYKQYILSAVDHKVPLLIADGAATTPAYVEALQEICDFAQENGVLFALRDSADADVVGLLSQVNNLYYCLDSAACIKNGVDVCARLAAVGKRLVYVLLADVGHDDTLYLPDYGNTDFSPIKAAIAATGYVGNLGIHANAAKGISDADAFIEAAKSLR